MIKNLRFGIGLEIVSGLLMLLICVLSMINVLKLDHDTFVVLSGMIILQVLSLSQMNGLQSFRMCVTWMNWSLLGSLAIMSLNILYTPLYALIAILNFISFVTITNLSSWDWTNFFQE